MDSKQYIVEMKSALDSINLNSVSQLTEALRIRYAFNQNVFVCGNGGSAAISEHFSCDHLKGIRESKRFAVSHPKAISLVSNLPLITAIANDKSYDQIFSYQIESLAKMGDLILLISSSGNSKNIVKALDSAHKLNLDVFAIVGFDGGKVKELIPENTVHIKSSNYGIVEDCSQSVMHMVSQTLS